MDDSKEISDFLKACNDKDYLQKDINSFLIAIDFAKKNLENRKRESGEYVYKNNVNIGTILVKSNLSKEIVIAGLLYGLEKLVIAKEIKETFGEDIASIIFGQLQFNEVKKGNKNLEAGIIRKILLTSLYDVRIILVKLAVKLASLNTIQVFDAKKQKEIAKEVLEIYVPLAARLGLEYIRTRLESLAFKVVYPKQYLEISNFFKETSKEREEFVKNLVEEIKILLDNKVGIVKVKGRHKEIRSIFKKILEKGTSLKEQKDHYAIRIIVKTVDDCYKTLGILHQNYEPLEEGLKDYINSPKPNGYQSIHTIIKIPKEKKEVEVQIRTQDMDEFAEEGGASHWSYKKLQSDKNFEKKVGWLRELIEFQKNSSEKDFMKGLKLDLFADKIYCYTPKGDVRELPKNATVLDFAYSIHQEIGEKSIGGRINGKFVSLKEPLKNGVVVEIVTNKNQRPRRDWLKFVISSRAKTKIKQGVKRYESIPITHVYTIENKKDEDYENLVECPEFPNAIFSLAKCCSPVPKDSLIAIMKSYKNFLVHKENCPRLKGNIKNAIPVFWKKVFNSPLKLKVFSEDRPGILADVLNTISREGFVVKKATAKIVSEGFTECGFVIIPKVLEDVYDMVNRVKKVRSVRKIFFE